MRLEKHCRSSSGCPRGTLRTQADMMVRRAVRLREGARTLATADDSELGVNLSALYDQAGL